MVDMVKNCLKQWVKIPYLFFLDVKNVYIEVKLCHDGGLHLPTHAGVLLVHEAEHRVGNQTLNTWTLVTSPCQIKSSFTTPVN